jgi:hypothetical protein
MPRTRDPRCKQPPSVPELVRLATSRGRPSGRPPFSASCLGPGRIGAKTSYGCRRFGAGAVLERDVRCDEAMSMPSSSGASARYAPWRRADGNLCFVVTAYASARLWPSCSSSRRMLPRFVAQLRFCVARSI